MRRGANREDQILATIGDLYGAVTDEALWGDVTHRLIDMFGGICATHAVVDPRKGEILHQSFVYDDATSLERYFEEGIVRLDPQARFATRLTGSRTWVDLDHLDRNDPDTAAFDRWIRSNSKLGHHLSAGAVLEGGAVMGALCVHRPQDEGVVPDEDRRAMDALLPHFHHASKLAFVHAEKVTAAYWDGLLARRDDAAALIGRDGRVLRLTPMLEAMLRAPDGLTITGDRLRAGLPDDDMALSAAIAGAHATRTSAGAGAARVRRPSGRSAFVVTVYPLAGPTALFARDDVAGLVIVVDPAALPVTRGQLYQELFGLTGRESQLADMLMIGHSVESAAAALEISRNTARIHLRRLFAKTETSRQSELVRLLARF